MINLLIYSEFKGLSLLDCGRETVPATTTYIGGKKNGKEGRRLY